MEDFIIVKEMSVEYSKVKSTPSGRKVLINMRAVTHGFKRPDGALSIYFADGTFVHVDPLDFKNKTGFELE